jgi:hypothetical protein
MVNDFVSMSVDSFILANSVTIFSSLPQTEKFVFLYRIIVHVRGKKDRQGSSVQCGTGCLSCGSGCAKTAPSRILQACKGPLPLSRIL